jgi:hypothetical protein
MSLDTVLQIGKALKNSEEGLHLFKYFKKCPKDDNDTKIIRLSLPMKEDNTFEWDGLKIIPENKIDEQLYLDYRTSDQDSSPKKYLFGDVFYSRYTKISKNNRLKKPNEYGNFTFEKGKSKNAFLNGEKIFSEIKKDFIKHRALNLLSEVKSDANRKSFIRAFLKGYLNDEPIKLPKKIASYEDKVEPIKKEIEIGLQGIKLFKFHNTFERNRTNINTLLFYAPAFFKVLEKRENTISDLLNNAKRLEDIYIETVLESDGNYIKKLFKKEEKKLLNKRATIEDLPKEMRSKVLSYSGFKVFLHFDFYGEKKYWHQFEGSIKILKNKLNSELVDKIDGFGLVPKKSIYRTLCSGNKKNDIQFPNFNKKESYKSFSFRNKQFEDFLYTSRFIKNPLYRVSGTSIAIYVLPKGDNLKGNDYLQFLETSNETQIAKKNNFNESKDSIFIPNINKADNGITSFDFIFSDSSGNTVNDLVELSGIRRSTLKEIMERINAIQRSLKDKYRRSFNTRIEESFKNLLGSARTKSGKVVYQSNNKYQNHVLRVLPKIYSQNYYQDRNLFFAFIEKVEFAIRNGDKKNNPWYFKDLKFHFEFLLSIQNRQNQQTNRYMEITNSESYQVGLLLGNLAKGLRSKINSFEKNYVGNLTRRISTVEDCIKFINEIEQKNILHSISYRNYNFSNDLANLISEIDESEYDKEKVAFGFFESYFNYENKKSFAARLKKLLADYSSNEEKKNGQLVGQINDILQNYQS